MDDDCSILFQYGNNLDATIDEAKMNRFGNSIFRMFGLALAAMVIFFVWEFSQSGLINLDII